MNKKITFTIFIILAVVLTNCKNKNENKKSEIISTISVEDSVQKAQDTTVLLISIRENFKRINTIKKWTSIKTKETLESSEGGEAKFYYQGEILEKISAIYFGEMGKSTVEYYLLDNKLSFVFDKTEQYNSPYYLTEKSKEVQDIELFDPKKTIFIETRSYFNNGKLFYFLTSEKNQANNLKEEEKNKLEQFESLILTLNSNQ